MGNVMKKVRIVDPTPEGWRYGFPKECPDSVTNLLEWAISEGYPEKYKDFCLFSVWYEEVDEV